MGMVVADLGAGVIFGIPLVEPRPRHRPVDGRNVLQAIRSIRVDGRNSGGKDGSDQQRLQGDRTEYDAQHDTRSTKEDAKE